MKTRRTLKPGDEGTKRLLDKYRDQLVCVRYKYDEVKRKRYTTIELIVEEVDWMPTHLIDVPIQIAFKEGELREKARAFGGHWDADSRCWYIPYNKLKKAGLENRLIRGLPQALSKQKTAKQIGEIGQN